MKRLNGKTALITGAAGGIGEAASRLFINEGANVVLLDWDKAALDSILASLPQGKALGINCDVSNTEHVQKAFQQALKTFSKLDILVLNAGVEGQVASLARYDEEDFDRVMNVNIKGTWLGLKYGIQTMEQSGGSIIATSSVAGLLGIAKSSAYVASKHAIIGLVKSAAAEVGRKGLRVNAICPSPVETRMMRALEDGANFETTGKAKEVFEKMMLLNRYGKPEEIANLMLFLASDESSFCTGGVYTVDGGYTTV